MQDRIGAWATITEPFRKTPRVTFSNTNEICDGWLRFNQSTMKRSVILSIEYYGTDTVKYPNNSIKPPPPHQKNKQTKKENTQTKSWEYKYCH